MRKTASEERVVSSSVSISSSRSYSFSRFSCTSCKNNRACTWSTPEEEEYQTLPCEKRSTRIIASDKCSVSNPVVSRTSSASFSGATQGISDHQHQYYHRDDDATALHPDHLHYDDGIGAFPKCIKAQSSSEVEEEEVSQGGGGRRRHFIDRAEEELSNSSLTSSDEVKNRDLYYVLPASPPPCSSFVKSFSPLNQESRVSSLPPPPPPLLRMPPFSHVPTAEQRIRGSTFRIGAGRIGVASAAEKVPFPSMKEKDKGEEKKVFPLSHPHSSSEDIISSLVKDVWCRLGLFQSLPTSNASSSRNRKKLTGMRRRRKECTCSECGEEYFFTAPLEGKEEDAERVSKKKNSYLDHSSKGLHRCDVKHDEEGKEGDGDDKDEEKKEICRANLLCRWLVQYLYPTSSISTMDRSVSAGVATESLSIPYTYFTCSLWHVLWNTVRYCVGLQLAEEQDKEKRRLASSMSTGFMKARGNSEEKVNDPDDNDKNKERKATNYFFPITSSSWVPSRLGYDKQNTKRRRVPHVERMHNSDREEEGEGVRRSGVCHHCTTRTSTIPVSSSCSTYFSKLDLCISKGGKDKKVVDSRKCLTGLKRRTIENKEGCTRREEGKVTALDVFFDEVELCRSSYGWGCVLDESDDEETEEKTEEEGENWVKAKEREGLSKEKLSNIAPEGLINSTYSLRCPPPSSSSLSSPFYATPSRLGHRTSGKSRNSHGSPSCLGSCKSSIAPLSSSPSVVSSSGISRPSCALSTSQWSYLLRNLAVLHYPRALFYTQTMHHCSPCELLLVLLWCTKKYHFIELVEQVVLEDTFPFMLSKDPSEEEKGTVHSGFFSLSSSSSSFSASPSLPQEKFSSLSSDVPTSIGLGSTQEQLGGLLRKTINWPPIHFNFPAAWEYRWKQQQQQLGMTRGTIGSMASYTEKDGRARGKEYLSGSDGGHPYGHSCPSSGSTSSGSSSSSSSSRNTCHSTRRMTSSRHTSTSPPPLPPSPTLLLPPRLGDGNEPSSLHSHHHHPSSGIFPYSVSQWTRRILGIKKIFFSSLHRLEHSLFERARCLHVFHQLIPPTAMTVARAPSPTAVRSTSECCSTAASTLLGHKAATTIKGRERHHLHTTVVVPVEPVDLLLCSLAKSDENDGDESTDEEEEEEEEEEAMVKKRMQCKEWIDDRLQRRRERDGDQQRRNEVSSPSLYGLYMAGLHYTAGLPARVGMRRLHLRLFGRAVRRALLTRAVEEELENRVWRECTEEVTQNRRVGGGGGGGGKSGSDHGNGGSPPPYETAASCISSPRLPEQERKDIKTGFPFSFFHLHSPYAFTAMPPLYVPKEVIGGGGSATPTIKRKKIVAESTTSSSTSFYFADSSPDEKLCTTSTSSVFSGASRTISGKENEDESDPPLPLEGKDVGQTESEIGTFPPSRPPPPWLPCWNVSSKDRIMSSLVEDHHLKRMHDKKKDEEVETHNDECGKEAKKSRGDTKLSSLQRGLIATHCLEALARAWESTCRGALLWAAGHDVSSSSSRTRNTLRGSAALDSSPCTSNSSSGTAPLATPSPSFSWEFFFREQDAFISRNMRDHYSLHGALLATLLNRLGGHLLLSNTSPSPLGLLPFFSSLERGADVEKACTSTSQCSVGGCRQMNDSNDLKWIFHPPRIPLWLTAMPGVRSENETQSEKETDALVDHTTKSCSHESHGTENSLPHFHHDAVLSRSHLGYFLMEGNETWITLQRLPRQNTDCRGGVMGDGCLSGHHQDVHHLSVSSASLELQRLQELRQELERISAQTEWKKRSGTNTVVVVPPCDDEGRDWGKGSKRRATVTLWKLLGDRCAVQEDRGRAAVTQLESLYGLRPLFRKGGLKE